MDLRAKFSNCYLTNPCRVGPPDTPPKRRGTNTTRPGSCPLLGNTRRSHEDGHRPDHCCQKTQLHHEHPTACKNHHHTTSASNEHRCDLDPLRIRCRHRVTRGGARGLRSTGPTAAVAACPRRPRFRRPCGRPRTRSVRKPQDASPARPRSSSSRAPLL